MTIAILHLGRTAAGPLLTLELSRALIEAGESVCVVYSEDAEVAPQLAALPCPTLSVRTFTNAFTALTGTLRLPQIAKRIGEFLDSHDVSTVVITMEQVWQSLLAPSIKRGRRVLLFVHDASPHPGEDGVLQRALIRRQRRNADGAVVLSQHVHDALASQDIFPDAIWRTVHPAFEAPEAEIRNIGSGPSVLGFFGRMSKYKGLELGVRAVSLLRERGYDIEFRITGNGIPRDIPNIESVGNVLDDRWIGQDEVVDTLRSFDLLLLPYIEASQSGVLAYAMALGIPSVVTPVGGLIEQARESGAAVIADAVTAEAIADAVASLLDSPSHYGDVSARALDSAKTQYSWRRTAGDTASAVKSLNSMSKMPHASISDTDNPL